MLSSRQLLIFKCIVDEFIETGQPVGSKALMTKYQLPYSSATIRSEMSSLEEYGYLEKMHTSSGRVPSSKGYRFYVQTIEHKKVGDDIKNEVSKLFSNRHRSLNEIIQDSCNMLSELTHLTTVVLGPNSDADTLSRISLVPIGGNKATLIIVTNQGHVQNKTFELSQDTQMEDMTSCVDVMNDLLVDTPISSIIERLERDVKPVLGARVKEHELLFNAFLEAFVKFASNNVYFSGKENLIYQPEFNDVNKLRTLVSAFDNSQMWNSLRPLMSEEEGITVKIGNESPIDQLNDVSIISGTFKTGDETKGTISVIGPTRMPYEKIVSLVDYITKNIEEAFNEEEEDRGERSGKKE